jgi:transposase
MQDTTLYSQILGLSAPWKVERVDLSNQREEIVIHIVHDRSEALLCPECARPSPGYDTRTRQWRHLDTCQMKTILSAEVPRLNCPEHGVRQLRVPWSEEGSGYTAMFEALVIDWLHVGSISRVATMMRLSWNATAGIMQRAVDRGLRRRDESVAIDSPQEPAHRRPKHLSVDEIAIAKGHTYLTIISDQDSGAVIAINDGRKKESLAAYLQSLSPEALQRIETISMDMAASYIAAACAHIPDAEKKICFDRFHVAQLLSKRVDQVRRSEHRALLGQGQKTLSKTKYLWLTNPENMSDSRYAELQRLLEIVDETSVAWKLKELAMTIWNESCQQIASAAWRVWFAEVAKASLRPMTKAAETIRRHIDGIINAMTHRRSNALAESLNSRIASIKKSAKGFRNHQRMKAAIFFHLGKLQLYPTLASG